MNVRRKISKHFSGTAAGASIYFDMNRKHVHIFCCIACKQSLSQAGSNVLTKQMEGPFKPHPLQAQGQYKRQPTGGAQ
uniref:Uncharacterized protein n=1 Tax=Anguilla anguilla TaxID=7936 RepID=A0A0E9WN61_ANGAN